jgi:hypothetical protein
MSPRDVEDIGSREPLDEPLETTVEVPVPGFAPEVVRDNEVQMFIESPPEDCKVTTRVPRRRDEILPRN